MMTSKEKIYLRRKWKKWLKIIGRDLDNLLRSQYAFNEISRLAELNKRITSPPFFYNWLVNNYAHSIIIGIRRLNDYSKDYKKRKIISLYKLIEDISKNRDAITRPYYVSRYYKLIPEKEIADSDFDKFSNKNDNLVSVYKLQRDMKRLKRDIKHITFVNKWVAHCDMNRKRFRVPTRIDLDNALRNIDELFCRYTLLLTREGTATRKSPLPVKWKEPLEHPWIVTVPEQRRRD